MSRPDRFERHPSLRPGLAIPAALLALGASAQEPPSRGFEDETTRILQVERVEGEAMVQRGGREIALQAGYLVFGQERIVVARDARADLRLAGLGDMGVVGDRGEAVVTVDKLPFSAWAVELDIWFRLERGRLSVDWRRPGAAERWPLFVQLGEWTAHLEAGEFLVQRTDGAGTICANSGAAELADDSGQRYRLESGSCVHLRDHEALSVDELRIEQWVGMARPAPELPAAGTGAQQNGMDRSLHAIIQAPAAIEVPEAPARLEVVPPPEPPPMPATAPAAVEPPAPSAPVVAPPYRSALPGSVPATPILTPAPATAPAAPPSGEQTATTAALAPLAVEPPTGPEWIINVLAVVDPALAEQHVRTLTAAGYPAELRTETVRGRSSFRVIIPGVNSEQAAERIVQLLAAKMGYPSAWALQKR